MRRLVFGCLTALLVVAVPRLVAADDGKRPNGTALKPAPSGPTPDALFNRLDVKHEGFIRLDKLPAGTPERLKEFLKRADVNHDGKVTREEFKKAFEARRHGQHHQNKPGGTANGGQGVVPGAKGQTACAKGKGPCPCAKGKGPCTAPRARDRASAQGQGAVPLCQGQGTVRLRKGKGPCVSPRGRASRDSLSSP